ncbi:hypothetical protein QBC39DRAFT_418924 [Podospora conica]|nr:hypothetical protein QBC39DRAFT_418924 [Schizothecium conicum]
MVKKKDSSSGKAKNTNVPSKKKFQQPKKDAPSSSSATLQHQQLILDIYKTTFHSVLFSPTFTTTLQSVKQALFDRDFARAFGSPENLAVYAARYSPTRSLCYAAILTSLKPHLDAISSPSQPPTHSPRTLPILSIGGGPSETVAVASFLALTSPTPTPSLSIPLTLLDSAPWSPPIAALTTTLTTPSLPSLPPFLPPSHFSTTFIQADCLTTPLPLDSTAPPVLITLLFTLNELFTASGVGATTKFLLGMTGRVAAGSLLLVVDSPGSYSETKVGGGGSGGTGSEGGRAYPMGWLVDRILLGGEDGDGGGRGWEKVEERGSEWFRLPDGAGKAGTGLEYPIPLENMRYQLHLYRALGV